MSIFPTLARLNIKVTRAPKYATLVQVGATGKELRASLQSEPRITYNMKINFLRETGFSPNTTTDEVKSLITFFSSVLGSFSGFYLVDPDASAVTNVKFATGTGTPLTFQLRDRDGLAVSQAMLTAGGLASQTITIYVDGVALAPADWSIDTVGVVTFDTPPGYGLDITWTGYFWRYVRFVDDELTLSQIVHRLWECESLDFISVK